MAKRGPKFDSPLTKRVREIFVVRLRLLAETFFGASHYSNREEQDRARTRAKEDVGSQSWNTFNTHFLTSYIISRGKKFFEKFFLSSWLRAKKVYQFLPKYFEELGIVKDRKEIKPIASSRLESSNNALSKLKGYENTPPPSGEEIFHIFNQLDINPEKIWPDELKKHKLHIVILKKLSDVLVHQRTVCFDYNEALHLDMICGREDTIFARKEDTDLIWVEKCEIFLKSILLSVRPSLPGDNASFLDHARFKQGMLRLKYHHKIMFQLVDKYKTRTVTKDELESKLNSE